MSYHVEMRKVAFTVNRFKRLMPRPHIHMHVELIYLKEGKSEVILDNKKYTLEAGDIFLAFPNQIHFYHDQEPAKGYLFIFAPEVIRELKEIFQTKIPVYPIIKGNTLSMDTREIMEKIAENLEQDSSMAEIAARGYLLALLAEMFKHMQLEDKPGDQEAIKRLLSYCIKNYTEPLTLESLAKELYLNKYYISHIFRERMNTNYKDFINQLRVEYACQLLEKDSRITEVAYACGFSSVRTFNRAFLKYMNMTPRDYVKKGKC